MTRREWYNYPRIGPCEACKKRCRRQAHHVTRQQDLAKEHYYDTRNRMLLGAFCCHYAHTQYGVNDRRIEFTKVPDRAILFAVEVLGFGPAMENFCRYYRGDREMIEARMEVVVLHDAA